MEKIIEKFIVGAIGGAFDATMSSFPGVATVWGAIKGGVSNIKEKRASEFIVFIQSNVLLDSFEDEKFVDGLAISFENFLRQRIDSKREVIKSILLGFTATDNKDEFELERLYDVLNRITIKQVDIFQNIKKYGKISIMTKSFHEIPNHNENYDDYKYLEFLGLVGISYDREIQAGYDESTLKEEEFAFITDFGEEFIKYIK